MAERPWATPAEVKAYTEYPSVSSRDNNKLTVDITRAEQYVISFTYSLSAVFKFSSISLRITDYIRKFGL